MPTFQDETGKSWTVSIRHKHVREVRERCDGLDLLAVCVPGSGLIDELYYDDIKLQRVVWAIVGVDNQIGDVKFDDFEEAMTPGVCESAFGCLMESLSTFLQGSARLPGLEKSLARLMTTLEASAKSQEAVAEMMRGFDPTKDADIAANLLRESTLSEIQNALSGSSGNLQGDSD